MSPPLNPMVVMGTLFMGAVAEPLYNNDRPARQTAVLGGLNYDAGLSPAPTPGPGAELVKANLEAREMNSNTCGFYHGSAGGEFWRTCNSSKSCWASRSWLACDTTAATSCHDGSESICDDLDQLPPAHMCCINSQTGALPFCATFIRSDDDGVWRTLLGCGNTDIGVQRTFTLVTDRTAMPPTYTTGETKVSSSSSSTAEPTSTSTPTPTPTPTPSNNPPSSGSSNTGGIVGGVIVWMVLRKRRASRDEDAAGLPPTPGYNAQSARPYELPGSQQGLEEHYEYQSVAGTAPSPQIHEAPGDSVFKDHNNKAELG